MKKVQGKDETQIEKVRFRGYAEAITPIAQVEGKGKDKVITIMRKPLPIFTTDIKGKKVRVEVPVLSSNTLRAKLRDALAVSIMRKVCKDGKGLDYYSLLTLLSGGTMTAGNNLAKHHFEAEDIRKKNIVVSIFGASLGSVNVSGRLAVDILWPVCKETQSLNMVDSSIVNHLGLSADDFVGVTFFTSRDKFADSDISGMSFLSKEGIADYEGFGKLADETTEKRHDDQAKNVSFAKVMNNKNSTDEDKQAVKDAFNESKVTTETPKAAQLQQFQTHEFVLPGTRFSSCFTIDYPSAKDIGAMLFALEQFAKKPIIGGFSSRGYGVVKLHYIIEMFAKNQLGVYEWAPVTDVVVGGKDNEFSYDSQILEDYLESYNDYLNGLQMEDLNIPKYFFAGKKKEDDPGKKAPKTKKGEVV